MRQAIIKLPSTAQIEFRQVKLAEENLLSVASKSKRGNVNQTLSTIMERCAVGIVDTGPYGFLEVGGKPKWDNMARGDRFAAMIDLRCLSYRDGELFEVELRCPGSMCGHKFDWEINLREDLIRQDIPSDSLDNIRDGKPFEVVVDGKRVRYTIALGKTEETYDRLCMQHPGRDMASALRARIVDVEGVKPHQIMDWLDGRNGDDACDFEGLTSEDAEELRDAFDRIDGGIDTSLEAECPKCHTWFEYDLPFSGIFLPGRGISKRRKELRRKAQEEKLQTEMERTPSPVETAETESSTQETGDLPK
jgi:hypothetical protein